MKPEDKPPPQPRKRIVVKKQFIPRERVKSESSDSTVSTVEEVEKPVTPEVEEPEETIVIAGMFYVSMTQISLSYVINFVTLYWGWERGASKQQ